jgi:hypothetical protein
MPISRATSAILVRVIAAQQHNDISTLINELGLEGVPWGSRLERANSLVRALDNLYTEPERSQRLLFLAERQLRTHAHLLDQADSIYSELKRAFEVDGYALVDGALIPATPAPFQVEEQVPILEQNLETRGFAVARDHYRQARENFTDGNYAAANGQTRSFLESLFIELCAQRTAKRFEDASAALQHLKNTGWFGMSESQHYRSFWADIQDNGPHQGLSDNDEALLRLHYATAVARYVLAKL